MVDTIKSEEPGKKYLMLATVTLGMGASYLRSKDHNVSYLTCHILET